KTLRRLLHGARRRARRGAGTGPHALRRGGAAALPPHAAEGSRRWRMTRRAFRWSGHPSTRGWWSPPSAASWSALWRGTDRRPSVDTGLLKRSSVMIHGRGPATRVAAR